MEVKQVEQVRQAEITKQQQIVAAEQEKTTEVIKAEGRLAAKSKDAEGVKVYGIAEADALKAKQLAPVEAQIVLAKEIGNNPGYQQYLATLEALKAYIAVGGKQAEALQDAEIKIIANTGNKPLDGVTNVMDLFTSKGGTELAGMVEAFAQTPLGRAVLGKFGVDDTSKSNATSQGNSEDHRQ